MGWSFPWSKVVLPEDAGMSSDGRPNFGAIKLRFVYVVEWFVNLGVGAAKLTGAVSGSMEWFSCSSRKGSLAQQGGWALYATDSFGLILFGDWWPAIGMASVILLLVLLVALGAYAISILLQPFHYFVRLWEWLGWRQLPSGVERLLPADDGIGPVRSLS